jgi:hypothetical protein
MLIRDIIEHTSTDLCFTKRTVISSQEEFMIKATRTLLPKTDRKRDDPFAYDQFTECLRDLRFFLKRLKATLLSGLSIANDAKRIDCLLSFLEADLKTNGGFLLEKLKDTDPYENDLETTVFGLASIACDLPESVYLKAALDALAETAPDRIYPYGEGFKYARHPQVTSVLETLGAGSPGRIATVCNAIVSFRKNNQTLLSQLIRP